MDGDLRGELQMLRCDLVRAEQARLSERQRSRLVEKHAVDVRKALKGGAVLDHDAFLEEAPRRHDLDDGDGKAERAGAGDDQDGDGDRHGCMPVAGDGNPAQERQQGDGVNGGRIERGSPVGQPAVARPSALGRLHHPDHFRKERVFGARGRSHRQRTGQIHQAGLERSIRCGRLRRALT